MSRLTIITDRALELVNQAGDGLKGAMPGAGKLLQTGAALGAVKTGGKVATRFVRRNPAVAVAAAAGLGLLAYAAYRKRTQTEQDALEGKSRRIEARKGNSQARRAAQAKSGASIHTPSGEAGIDSTQG